MVTDFRDAVFLAVRDVMTADDRAVVLYNDMGALELSRLKADFPSRVYNVGICEQNMASLAAGLAMSGRRVFIYGIIAHVFARSYEQIRNDICCSSLPVVILGVGSGLSYGADGPTHHGVQDIAVMRTLPNLTIFNPADCASAAAMVKLAGAIPAPSYVRMDKEVVPALYADTADYSAGFRVLQEGQDVALVTTGVMVHRAMNVAGALVEEGINVRVIDLFRLKPVAAALLARALAGVRAVVTLEENSPIGGLASIVGELLARGAEHPRFETIGLGDEVLTGSAGRDWADKRFGLDAGSVVAAIRRILQSAASS